MPDSAEFLLNIILVFTALEHSTIYDQLVDNDDNALQVKSLLSHSGLAMETGDWRLEAEGFFQSTLAYLQNEVVNIANGAFHDIPGTYNLLDSLGDDWSGICDKVLVATPGMKSVSLQGLIAILSLCMLITILSINPEKELVVLHFITQTASKLINLGKKLARLILSLYQKVSTWIIDHRRRNQLPRNVTFVRILNVPVQRRR